MAVSSWDLDLLSFIRRHPWQAEPAGATSPAARGIWSPQCLLAQN
uniref:Ribosomal protein L11 n=1 Tax=Homo sapiens TaxID=9606 RepID=A0A2R8Y447_HUMAN